MNNPIHRGKGKTARFLWEHAAGDTDDCVIWPFNRLPNGYGTLTYLGRNWYAHRFMCVLAHGEAPSVDHQATHTCGKGHDGCINPRHLEWKTNGENQLDRREHGTKNNATWGKKGKLTPQQRLEILSLKGKKTQREIATMYGVTFQNVSHIHRAAAKAP